MRISWGYSILFTMTAFAAMMGYLVYRSVNTNYELVSDKYYNEELEYQKVIDAGSNALSLSHPVAVDVDKDQISIQFPEEMQSAAVTGMVRFYCPTAAQKDRKFKLDIRTGGRQDVPLSLLDKGAYMVKIDWAYAGKNYYTEQQIFLP